MGEISCCVVSKEKKEEEKKNEGEKKEEEKKEEKKEEEPQEIVLKVDMHCEACARKVARSLRGFQGVEEVTADCKASKVVVKGKTADPIKVLERIQKKSGRKVELISPLPKPPEDNKEETKEQPKEDKKEEPPAVVTVVLKVGMHCEACAQVLQKRIRKIPEQFDPINDSTQLPINQGHLGLGPLHWLDRVASCCLISVELEKIDMGHESVESAMADLANDQVTVKGIIDPTKLVNDVYKKTRKQASIVKEEEKKEEEKKEGEKKEGGEGEKKEGEEGKGGDEDKKTDIKKSEYWHPNYAMEYAYPPQIFSDENPNACAVM
ncbi:unnamed protein product [Camellia sinensis]